MEREKKEEFLAEVKRLMPEYEFEIGSIMKRNDNKKEALFITGEEGKVAPIFYLDDYSHLSAVEMANRAQQVIDMYSISQDEIAEILLSPEYVKNNVRLQLVNTDYISLGENGEAKACLQDAILEGMGLDINELKELALQNMWDKKEMIKLTDIVTRSRDIESMIETERILNQLEKGKLSDMVIITNAEHIEGAATILCPEFLEKCNQDIVILPSSCHELIIMPYDTHTDLRSLQKMVEEINLTNVDEKDVLSDNVYVFDCEKKTISLACDTYGLTPICDETKLQLVSPKAVTK